MPDRETRFEAHAAKRRQHTIGVVALVLLIGYFRDTQGNGAFPSGATIVLAVAAFVAFEVHAAFRGARSLSISASGITLERSFGGKVLRLAWSDISRVEVRRPLVGLVWTFYMKEGREIRWAQSDFDGNQRLELEKTLRSALQKHGVKLG